MAYRENVSLPAIGRDTPRNYDIVQQSYSAINVDDPYKVTLTEPEGEVTTIVKQNNSGNGYNPRIHALEDKVSMAMVQGNQAMAQQQQVADALNQQNMLTKSLIDKAFQNRDDFIDSLGRLTDHRIEGNTRNFLQTHLKYITAIVQRLNNEITALEDEIRLRDRVFVTTNHAVGKLEVHQVTMLQDLRTRIVRCDACLMRHSADIRNCYAEIHALSREQQNIRTGLVEKIHQMEAEMISMGAELSRLTEQQAVEIVHMKKDSNRELSLLEEKNSSSVMEVKRALHDLELATSTSRQTTESRLMSLFNKAAEGWKDIIQRLETTVTQNGDAFENRLSRLENAISADRGAIKELQKVLENRVLSRLNAHSQQVHQELLRAKREYREDFSKVHDSIANAKAVIEGKCKIMEDRITREVGKLRKIVVYQNE